VLSPGYNSYLPLAAVGPEEYRFRPRSGLRGSRMKKTGLIAATLVLLGFSTFAQDDKPLGDVARESRACKPSQPKAAKVATNDDVPSSEAVGGALSPQKQHFCDEFRRKNDYSAEQSCSLLALDMGSEYETLTARIFELGKGLCAAYDGRIPTNILRDSPHGAEACEASDLYARFMELWEAQTKAFNAAERELNAVRQEHYRELDSNLPGWNKRTGPFTDPQEKQRFRDIEAKYRPREEEKEKVVGQMRARGNRFLLDDALWEKLCDYSKSSQSEPPPWRK
jgi:hypothetical protein